MPRLKKRKDNRYQQLINVLDENGNKIKKEDGTYKRKPVYGYTQKELEENVKKAYEAEIEKSKPANNLTLGEWADIWLVDKKLDCAYNTGLMYEFSIDTYIKPVLGDLKLQDILIEDIEKLLNAQKEKGRRRTAQVIHLTLKQIFESARKRKYIIENPMLDIEQPKYKSKKKRALSNNEVNIINAVRLNIK